jgi:pre-mRNA-processing factor 19
MRLIGIGTTPGHLEINRVAYDPKNRMFVAVSSDGYLLRWSAVDAAPQREIRIGAGAGYDLSIHDGLAVTAAGNTVVLIDLASGSIVRRYRGHGAAVTTAQFHPDGRWFVTGDDSGKVLLWDVAGSEHHAELAGHTEGVLDAVFVDSATLYTASHDGTVRYWRPPFDESIDTLRAELAQYGSRQ